ncbi:MULTISPECIES: TrmB family transcriptional regulator [unclassified Stygiolobus]|uniref:TrmB family transcriptional regulator n=1 Tax=unclassified Stygiolobus TaxID=2824672 RepID=UPI00307CE4AA
MSPLFPKDHWRKFGRKENSKNSAKDEKKQRVEKVSAKSEKVKSSTQNKREPGKSGKTGKNVSEMPEMPESPRVLVDDSNKSKSRETEKNRISAEEFITRDTVESEDGRRKVKIDVYRIGEEEKIEDDKVVRRAKLKFVIWYSGVVKECVDDCTEAISEVAKATDYKVPKKAISKKIAELREEYGEEEKVPLIDYVRQKYPDRLAEIERDPIAWIMSRTNEIVGHERLKLLTFLSLVSTRMERVMGMSRIHIMLVGGSGVGKSSTVKSVLKYAEDIVIPSTRVTQNALGYLNVHSFDGKALFIEQIDKQNMNCLRELMTEEKICTVVTEKETGEDGKERHVARQRCIEGQPAVITTSVVDTIDVDKEQIFNRMLKVYVKTDSSTEDMVWQSIIDRSKVEISPVDAMVFKAWLLTRPSHAKIPEDVTDAVIDFMKKLKEYTREPLNRTVEIARNLIIVTAIMRGRTEATLEDWQFVLENFQLDLLYNGLGLTERDVEIIEKLPDEGGLKSSEVADALKVSKQYTINLLKNLERKGVVEGEKTDGKTFMWYLTALGRRIKALVNNLDKDVVEVRDEKGELVGVADSKFRPDDDSGVDRGDAVRRVDGDAMQRGDGENNHVAEAYKFLKEYGSISTAELTEIFGDDIIEKLKAKDLVTFNIIDGVEYVNAK